MFPSLLHVKQCIAALAVCCAAAAAAAVSSEQQAEINRLLAAGQTAEAMAHVDRLLQEHPRDPQLRFQKGVMLSEMRRRAEAIDIFTQLTIDYPEIPEPYNNLAVLHAAAGEYEKARAELDAALRANPNYAVAHQNLGDVYAQLARQSYAKALQLDPSNAAVPPKLALLRELTLKGKP